MNVVSIHERAFGNVADVRRAENAWRSYLDTALFRDLSIVNERENPCYRL